MIRALCLILCGLISVGTAAGQDNATRFDEAGLSKQQQADILRVTGDESPFEGIPGKPFIEFLGLSTDTTKPPQIVAWRGSGYSGNKDIWVFRQAGDHAVLILENAGGSEYSALPSVHRGMHDFSTYWTLGAATGGNEVYEFDGKQYRPAYCFDTVPSGSYTEPEKDGPHHPCKEN